MAAYVACENCGAQNRCEIQPSPETVRSGDIGCRTQPCTACGAPIIVDAGSIFFRPE
jgi:hypothetical protein